MPKELTLDQRLGNRCTIHGHKRFRTALALLVYGSRNEFFTRSTFAANQHRRIGVRHFADQIVDLAHLLALPNDVAHVVAAIHFRTQVEHFPHEILVLQVLQRARQQRQHFVDGKRLDNVIVGARLDGIDCRTDLGVGGNDNDRHIFVKRFGLPQHLHAIHIRQAQIEQDNVNIFLLKAFDAFFAAHRRVNAEFIFEDRRIRL